MSILSEPQCEAPYCDRFGRDRVAVRLPTGHPWVKRMERGPDNRLALRVCPPCAGRAVDIYPAWPTADNLMSEWGRQMLDAHGRQPPKDFTVTFDGSNDDVDLSDPVVRKRFLPADLSSGAINSVDLVDPFGLPGNLLKERSPRTITATEILCRQAEVNLAPCASCGGRAKIDHVDDVDIYPSRRLKAHCGRKGCPTYHSIEGIDIPLDGHLEMVVRAWNKNHSRPAKTDLAIETDQQTMYLQQLVNDATTKLCVRSRPMPAVMYKEGRYHVHFRCQFASCKNHGHGQSGSFQIAAATALATWNQAVRGVRVDE